MYFMYVDESGDVGTLGSPSRYFVLSCIVFHETNWQRFLNNLVVFRRSAKAKKGLLLKDEIHAAEFIRGNCKSRTIKAISKNDRLDLLKQCLTWTAQQDYIRVITVCVDKQGKGNTDIFELAWKTLLMRVENTIGYGNFVGAGNRVDHAVIISDNTNDKQLVALVRKMRHYNPVPNTQQYGGGHRNLPIKFLIEDPVLRDSRTSLTHQIVDVIAYFARQTYETNGYLRKKGGRNFYSRLLPVILKQASPRNPLGIVEL